MEIIQALFKVFVLLTHCAYVIRTQHEPSLTLWMQLEMFNSVSLLFLDMVQLEQYDVSPSVSVESDAHVEVLWSKTKQKHIAYTVA